MCFFFTGKICSICFDVVHSLGKSRGFTCKVCSSLYCYECCYKWIAEKKYDAGCPICKTKWTWKAIPGCLSRETWFLCVCFLVSLSISFVVLGVIFSLSILVTLEDDKRKVYSLYSIIYLVMGGASFLLTLFLYLYMKPRFKYVIH